ncbi:cytochrome-c peroxidase [Kordiimonas lipolytica]|nr:cytochrome c peroxidase [Kordiimonas lipolytica]
MSTLMLAALMAASGPIGTAEAQERPPRPDSVRPTRPRPPEPPQPPTVQPPAPQPTNTGTTDTIGDTTQPPATRLEAPQLPDVLLNYTDATLPAYYRRGRLADADNTPEDNPITNTGATLGRVLFYDVKLSANDTVSCASCHQQANGFSDPATLSTGFDGGQTARHSMSLANARFYERGHFFWDERAETLEDQVLMPVQDSVEMGMTLIELETKLQATDYYGPLFEAAFGSDTVTSDRIAKALAQFVRAMTSTNTRYDSAFTGGGNPPDFEAVFTPQEIQGLVLFGQGGDRAGRTLGCAACHGTPGHIADDIHNNGLDITVTGDDGAGDKRFKAPSLRNIAVTAPYMHDGRFETLEEVIEFYNSGVQPSPNLDQRLRRPGGQPRRLNMTQAEKDALLAFLNTLTDESLLVDERFSDPFIAH